MISITEKYFSSTFVLFMKTPLDKNVCYIKVKQKMYKSRCFCDIKNIKNLKNIKNIKIDLEKIWQNYIFFLPEIVSRILSLFWRM